MRGLGPCSRHTSGSDFQIWRAGWVTHDRWNGSDTNPSFHHESSDTSEIPFLRQYPKVVKEQVKKHENLRVLGSYHSPCQIWDSDPRYEDDDGGHALQCRQANFRNKFMWVIYFTNFSDCSDM